MASITAKKAAAKRNVTAKKAAARKPVTAKKAAAKKAVTAKKAAVKTPVTAKKAAAKKPAAKKARAKKAASRKPRGTPHPMVHWEIQSRDPKRLQDFYASVFEWAIDANNPMNYGMVSSAGAEGINGGIGGTTSEISRVVVYASVPDIEATLARIGEHGGKTLVPRTDLGMVVMALYTDPEGNVLGLVEE